jgi:uncharacterized protein YgbK (DUF1537 family)
MRAAGWKVVVLDDDPTGTQTVAGVPVLTSWTVGDLTWGLEHADPTLFVLTNSRALSTRAAATINRRVARNCLHATSRHGFQLSLLSLGDSTLRSHLVAEIEALDSEICAANSGQAATVVLCPAFPEMGRVTFGGAQLVRTSSVLGEVGGPAFAKGPTFGDRSSRLSDWMEESSEGHWRAEDVIVVDLETIRSGGATAIAERIAAAGPSHPVALDAVSIRDVEIAAAGVQLAESRGSAVLLRCGPTMARARGGLPRALPISDEALKSLCETSRSPYGLVIVGSPHPLTTAQVAVTLQLGDVELVELDVARVLDASSGQKELDRVALFVARALHGSDVLLQASRAVNAQSSLRNQREAARVAEAIASIVTRIVSSNRLSWIVAKGGATSYDVITKVLRLQRTEVVGPILPGVGSLWHDRSGDGPLMIAFPGQAGNDESLRDVVVRLRFAIRTARTEPLRLRGA